MLSAILFLFAIVISVLAIVVLICGQFAINNCHLDIMMIDSKAREEREKLLKLAEENNINHTEEL